MIKDVKLRKDLKKFAVVSAGTLMALSIGGAMHSAQATNVHADGFDNYINNSSAMKKDDATANEAANRVNATDDAEAHYIKTHHLNGVQTDQSGVTPAEKAERAYAKTHAKNYMPGGKDYKQVEKDEGIKPTSHHKANNEVSHKHNHKASHKNSPVIKPSNDGTKTSRNRNRKAMNEGNRAKTPKAVNKAKNNDNVRINKTKKQINYNKKGMKHGHKSALQKQIDGLKNQLKKIAKQVKKLTGTEKRASKRSHKHVSKKNARHAKGATEKSRK